MSGPKEIPQLVTELVDMSKTYLRQETLEPAKRLGKVAGFGTGAGLLFGLAAVFFVLGVYALFQAVLPEGEWWVVLSRLLTTLVAAGGVALLGARMAKA